MSNPGQPQGVPSKVTDAVLKPSDPPPEGATPVSGIDFDKHAGQNISVADMVADMTTMGFQATSVGQAANIINDMVGYVDPSCGDVAY